MFYERLPYTRLMLLADLSPNLTADVDALYRLADYALTYDTGGLIPREIATALVPDPRRVDRLQRAELLHDAPGVAWCRCAALTAPACWSVHAPVLQAAYA